MNCDQFNALLIPSQLKISPKDIAQRILYGYNLQMHCYFTGFSSPECCPCCPVLLNAPFSAMCEDNDPLVNLPIIFNSSSYRSPYVTPLNATTFGVDYQYWIGPSLSNSDPHTLNVQTSNGTQFSFTASGWNLETAGVMYRSAQTTLLYYEAGQVWAKKSSSNAIPLGGVDDFISALHLSGDGSTYFYQRSVGTHTWYRWSTFVPNSPQWVSMNSGLSIGCSFDGKYTCSAIWLTSTLQVTMYSDYTASWSASISAKESDGYAPYLAMLDKMVFVALGMNVYSVGSNRSPTKILGTADWPLTQACTGIWADELTLWVRSGDATYMSNNGGWTWIKQSGVRAVSRGLYISSQYLDLVAPSLTRFQDDGLYPLKLNNRGLLSSVDGGWQNDAFELKTGTDDFTIIDYDTRYAISPNGLFVLDNDVEGNVVLRVNLWRVYPFQKWLAANPGVACPGLSIYCDQLQDADCQTGNTQPIDDGNPTDTNPPPEKPKSTPVGLIIGIALGVVFIAGLGFWLATRKSSKK